MRYPNFDRRPQNRVMALFDARAVSFDIAPSATIEDLAKRLAHLRERDDGALVSVEVRLHLQERT